MGCPHYKIKIEGKTITLEVNMFSLSVLCQAVEDLSKGVCGKARIGNEHDGYLIIDFLDGELKTYK